MDPLPSNAACWPASTSSSDLELNFGILPPGLVADGVGIDVLGAGGSCRGRYDPYSTLERIGSTEELRSVSNNRLFLIDRTPPTTREDLSATTTKYDTN